MQPSRVPIPRQIDPALEQRLRGELAPAEVVSFSTQPLPSAFRGEIIGLIIGALFWNGITWTVFGAFILGMAHGKKGPPAIFLLFFIPFVAIGVWILAAPLWTRTKHKRIVYAITDRRAIILTIGVRGGVTVQTYRPDRLTGITRKERADGSGDLIFEQFREGRGSGSTTVKCGFIGISDVKAVEELITRTLLADRVQAV